MIESTRFDPSMVVFGRHLTLPIDLIAHFTQKERWSEGLEYNEQYVMKLQSVLHEINEQARANLQLANLKQSKYYNRLIYYQY